MDLGIRGKTALVLGGNRGIGRGIAQALADEGVNVAITGRDISRGDAAATEIAARSKTKTAFFALDLSDTASLKPTADRIGAEFGPVDILVNNTGGPDYGGASSRDLQEWSDRFQDMVVSVIALTDAILPGMRQRKWGRIMSVISSGVLQPIPVLAVSNSLRAAVVGWSKTLSSEVAADGVTVNILVPGRIETERVRLTDEAVAERQKISVDEARKRSFATIPMGRYGTVEEFGAMAAFIASRQASYVTGAMLRVDGGIVRSW
jgi:3-oxoacyl-[acyl-carrier protein] reductase